MTTITVTETAQTINAECIIDGIDILADVMGGCGVEQDERGFVLDSEQADWWVRWAEREERIATAYAQADEETRAEYERAIVNLGYDMEALQDEQESILGIA